jgi:hypothetical protein
LDWQKGKLTSKEALRNLGELINTESENKSHYWETLDKIMDSEMQNKVVDEELDAAYWSETHGD